MTGVYEGSEYVLTTNQGTHVIKVDMDIDSSGSYSGTYVIDISGTFAFNEADIRTLTNVDFYGEEDTDGNEQYGGTATLNGEEVTLGLDEVSSLEVTSVGNATNGTVIIDADGEVQYTPNAAFIGTDNFSYIVTDSITGEVSTATVSVDVLAIEGPPVDATIQTDVNNYLDNLSLDYFKDGLDTGISTLVEGGDISFPVTSLDFDAVKLSDPAAHTSGIAADDAVAALRHIVHLDEIDTFDLIDNTTGNREANVTTLYQGRDACI